MAKKFQSQKSALQQVLKVPPPHGRREEGDMTTSAGLNDPWEAQGQTQDSRHLLWTWLSERTVCAEKVEMLAQHITASVPSLLNKNALDKNHESLREAQGCKTAPYWVADLGGGVRLGSSHGRDLNIPSAAVWEPAR